MMTPRRRYLLQRLFYSVVTLWVGVTIVFVLFRALPGNPAVAILDPMADLATQERMIERFGLDQPLHVQYLVYLRNLAAGDLGRSFVAQQPVLERVYPRFRNTLVLTFFCLIASYSFGILSGMILAWKRGTWLDTVGSTVSLVLRSMPPFWTGLMAIMFFSFYLGWLPLSGMRSSLEADANFFQLYFNWDFLRHLLLPLLVGSLYFQAVPMLLVRNTMLESFGSDHVELAKAKGLKDIQVLYRHVLRNSILPVFTQGTFFIGWALGGLVTIEFIFSWPGIGMLLVESISNRDYPVAQGAFIFISFTVVLLNLLADLLYVYIDPRIELK